MTHASTEAFQAPAHLSLPPLTEGDARDTQGKIRLIVDGQGTIGFSIAEQAPFSLGIFADTIDGPGFRWEIDGEGAHLHERRYGEWRRMLSVAGAGLDAEPKCPYWFSIDTLNRVLRYGKGETRLGCMWAEYPLGSKPRPGDDDYYRWLATVEQVELSAEHAGAVDIWRDPVTVDPPLRIVPHDEITMDQMAKGELTVPANLTATCQQLYDNVAGKAFVLNTPDFPQFSEAIKRSILTKRGWCYKTLERKASEFGKRDPDKTYLRITMGQNQGDSPGIPFVMEIWPVDHYSPIHNHGGADAVIKVLHGAITVDMFPMLSKCHLKPFARATFEKDEVTWISPRLNQFHQLRNLGRAEPCITIQCYMYAENNRTHYPYFDYLNDEDIGHFDPDSDADYLAFKAIMRKEWEEWSGKGAIAES